LNLFGNTVKDQISNLFKIAVKVNLDGIVCSPHELKIANIILGSHLVKITPGIRDIQAKDDQARTMSAKEAIERGSSFLVIGRPITQAEDIAQALQNFNNSIYEK
jgi:orotidine-5'-phosphate decarboxylase